MFERLLAALIILALLVLVMFIALPYPTRSDRPISPTSDPVPQVEPAPAPAPAERAEGKPGDAGKDDVAKNDALPPPPPEKPAPGAQDVPVPNPPAGGVDNKAPATAEKADRETAGGNAPPKQKFVKYQDKLPISPSAEPPPKALPTARHDKPIEDRPKVNASKADRLRTETSSRTTVQRRPERVLIKGDRERDDDIGEYIRRTDYDPPGWNRTHYYECADGRCDCSCDRPYWARRGPPCWD